MLETLLQRGFRFLGDYCISIRREKKQGSGELVSCFFLRESPRFAAAHREFLMMDEASVRSCFLLEIKHATSSRGYNVTTGAFLEIFKIFK